MLGLAWRLIDADVVTVTMQADKGAAASATAYQARLTLGAAGSPVAHAAVYTLIK